MIKTTLRYRYKGRLEYHQKEFTHLWWDEDGMYIQDRTTTKPPVVLQGLEYWSVLLNQTGEVDGAHKTTKTQDRG